MQNLNWNSTLAVTDDASQVYRNTAADRNADWERPTFYIHMKQCSFISMGAPIYTIKHSIYPIMFCFTICTALQWFMTPCILDFLVKFQIVLFNIRKELRELSNGCINSVNALNIYFTGVWVFFSASMNHLIGTIPFKITAK